MKRRDFVKASALFSGGLLLPWATSCSYDEPLELVILHTNDVHSRIDPFPSDHPTLAALGGAARRAELVHEVRKNNQHVVLVDAGDIFQGTPYFNYYKGELEFKLMSLMKYDAATLGNHDFDAGLEGLLTQWPHAKFPFVSANYQFKNTPLRNAVPNSIMVRRGPLRIGVFGLGIALDGLVDPALSGRTEHLEPLQCAKEEVANLKASGADYIICLSHLGNSYENDKVSDQVLAKEVPGIDLVVGGHTHTFLQEPQIIEHKNHSPTLVVQTGWGGAYLGQVKVQFLPGGEQVVNAGLLI